MLSRTPDGIAKLAIGMALLSLLSVVCGGDARCQTPAASAPDPKELHGGIEVALRSVRAIVLRVSTNAEGDNIPKILSSDQINPSTPFPKDDKPTSEYTRDLAQAIQTLSEKLQNNFRVPPNQIHLLGLSDLTGQIRDDLNREVRERLGKEITFLDAKSETELNIAGNIPRRYTLEGKVYDNRSISLLLDISSTNVRGGYQQLSMTSRGRTEYDYVTWDIPINGPLKAEAAQNPGLMMRKKVYLVGNIVWALAALLYPQNQGDYVPLTIEDINSFYNRAMLDPEALLNPDLSKIRDDNARKEARKGREAIKAIFTPRTLAAGAETLKLAATDLNLADKRLIFARNSNWARLLNFVRIQLEQ
jgi:hypothetical protein